MLKHYVEYHFKDIYSSEYQTKEVKTRNPKLIKLPKGAFAFRFFDRTEVEIEGEKLVGNPKNYSPLTYYGKIYTLEEVKAQFPYLGTLILNMESNGSNRVVRTIRGNWCLLEEGDIVLNLN